MRLDRAVDVYLRHISIERGLSEHTVAAYRRDLARYLTFLAERDIVDVGGVSEVEISEFVRHLGQTQARTAG